MSQITNDTVVRLVINGYSQGESTWGEVKKLAHLYGATIVAGNQKAVPPVYQLRGGSKQPKRG